MATVPKRDTTIQATVKEAEEFLRSDAANGEEQEPAETHRQGTMEATAEEGIRFLKDSRHDTLLEAQGLVEKREKNGAAEAQEEAPSTEKQGTMAATAAEGEKILEEMGGSPKKEARTREQAKKAAEADQQDDQPHAKKAKVQRETTMDSTAKEGKDLLKDEKLGQRRSETAEAKETPEKPSPKRESTMQKTAQEGKEYVEKSA